MTRATRWSFRHVVLCFVLGIAAPSGLPAQEGGSAPPPDQPLSAERPDLAGVGEALEALAAGKVREARQLLGRADRGGGSGLPGLMGDLLDAQRRPPTEAWFLQAEARGWQIPGADYRAVVPRLRAALAEAEKPEPRRLLRGLLCHLRVLGGVEGPPEAEGGRVVSGDLQAPERTFQVQPDHTPEARRAGVQGVVIMQFVIDLEGCVKSDPKVQKGLPHGLDDAARGAIRWWVYEPAVLEGEPVSVYYNTTMNFRLP
ncbi:MAG TPA: energy transducer TonB [Thermoanaerobaculia bacterium]|nr:energy transducer TonB [Thermoanaerobaculia bacterium]